MSGLPLVSGRTLGCWLAACLSLSLLAPWACSATHNEHGDAGEFTTAQIFDAPYAEPRRVGQMTIGSGSLTAINGTLDGTVCDFADLYLLQSVAPTVFSAELVCLGQPTPNLFLFDGYTGAPLSWSSACNNGRTRVTPRVTMAPGYYWLAVTRHGAMPTTLCCEGVALFGGVSQYAEDQGPEFACTGDLWHWGMSCGGASLPYSVVLAGAGFASTPPTPTAKPSWGRIKQGH